MARSASPRVTEAVVIGTIVAAGLSSSSHIGSAGVVVSSTAGGVSPTTSIGFCSTRGISRFMIRPSSPARVPRSSDRVEMTTNTASETATAMTTFLFVR